MNVSSSLGISIGPGSNLTALSTCCSSPRTGRAATPGCGRHFDRPMSTRINAHEVTALSRRATASRRRRPSRRRSTRSSTIATFPRPDTKASTEVSGAAARPGVRPSTTFRFRRIAKAPGRGRAAERPAARLTSRRQSLARGAKVPADDSERLPRRGTAARPRLRPGHRERLQDRTPCRRPSAKGPWQFMKPTAQGPRPEDRLVHRRAFGF